MRGTDHIVRVLAIAVAAGALLPPALFAAEHKKKFLVSAKVLKKDFALLEPILLQVNMKNTGEKDVSVPAVVPGVSLVFKVSAGGKTLPWLGHVTRPAAVPKRRLGGGAQGYVVLNLLEYFNMQKSGEYAITVRYLEREASALKRDRPVWRVLLERAKVKVRRPTRKEANAIKGVDRSKGKLKRKAYHVAAARIVLFYKDTAYYKYAWYWLGYALEGDFLSEESLRSYRIYLGENRSSPLRDDVRFRILRLRVQLGEVKVGDVKKEMERLRGEVRDLAVKDSIKSYLKRREKLMKALEKDFGSVPPKGAK